MSLNFPEKVPLRLMGHLQPQDVTESRWDQVAVKLDLALHSVQSPVTPFGSIRTAWADVPVCLAERGLLLQGLPAICIPAPENYVHEDMVHDTLSLWSNERLRALDRALSSRTLTIVPREPLSRRAIFELVDVDGRRKDTTLGFSEGWQLRNMFTEQIYQARTSAQLRTMNIDSLLPILRRANLTTTHIPWASLPPKLWSSGQYMSGLPRICLPTVVNDKISSDDPSPTTNWKKDQRVALQRSLDSGLLKILPRTNDRNVIFEVIESDGSLRATDCGLSAGWKLEHVATMGGKEKRSVKRKAARDSQPKAPATIPAIPWPQFHQTESYQKKMNILENYMRLLRAHGLLLDSPEGPAWVYVPQMLATKRLYVSGLPRICLPLVRDDDVLANYDPTQWNEAAQDAFMHALSWGQLKVLPATYGERVLYKTLEPSGKLNSDVLGFSERWCRENLDPPDISSISPSVYNIEMWLGMLEGVGIPCHDLRGRRRIQWLQLPLVLAHRRLYISGCPVECLPRAEDDVVVELSSPYFYDDHQVALMYEAFTTKRVSIRSRAHHRNVLFAIETEAGSMDLNCGFSNLWIQMNMQTLPNAVNISIPSRTQGKSLPVPTYAVGVTPPKGVNRRCAMHQRNPPASAMTGTAYPTPTDSAPASPISVASAGSQQKTAEDLSRSLKIIIPAFKRRHLLTTTSDSSSSSSSSQPLQQGLVVDSSGPKTPTPSRNFPEPFITQVQPSPTLSRHMLPSRRSVVTIEQPSPRRHKRQLSPLISDTEDHPGSWGLRASMSPRLPPMNTLPDPLPPVPIPTFLPKPGGNLTWDEKRLVWELTISEVWPPEEWKKTLPVFPARVTWNAIQKIWICEPSKSLTPPPITNVGLSHAVRVTLAASTRDGDAEPIREGLSIIWHRWRRAWGLFEYVTPTPPPSVS